MLKYIHSDEIINEWTQFYIRLEDIEYLLLNQEIESAITIFSNQIERMDSFYTNFGSMIKEERDRIISAVCEKQKVDSNGYPRNKPKREVRARKASWFQYKKFISYYTSHAHKNTLIQLLQSHSKLIQFKKYNVKNIIGYADKHEYDNRVFSEKIIELLKASSFYINSDIETSFKQTNLFYNRVYRKHKKRPDEIAMRLRYGVEESGLAWFLSGLLVALNLLLCKTLIENEHFPNLSKGVFVIYGYFLLFGGAMKIFQKMGINYTLIFKLDPISTFDISRYQCLIGTYTCLLLSLNLIVAYLFDDIIPLILSYCIVFLLSCIPIPLYWRARFRFLRTVGRATMASFVEVEFGNFFIADYLTSMAPAFYLMYCDLHKQSTSVYFLICLYPQLLRILQCLRRYSNRNSSINIYNIGKYTLNIISLLPIIAGSPMIPTIILRSISSTACLYWDLKYDWVLHKKHIIFSKFTHSAGILLNIVARYFWCIDLYYKYNLCLLTECIRRTVWAIFRIETEHLNNCNLLRVTSILHKSADDDLFYVHDEDSEREEKSTDVETIDFGDETSNSQTEND